MLRKYLRTYYISLSMASEREVEITKDVIFEMFDSVKRGCGTFCYKRGYKQHCKSKRHREWETNCMIYADLSDSASTSTTATRGRASR